jgi:hypothetical protein
VESLRLVHTVRAKPIAQTEEERQRKLQARTRRKLTALNRRNMLHSDDQRGEEFLDSWTISFEALDGLCIGEAVQSGEWVVHFCTTCQADDAGEEYRSLVSHGGENRPVLTRPGGRRLFRDLITDQRSGAEVRPPLTRLCLPHPLTLSHPHPLLL